MYKILSKRKLNDTMTWLVIEAPLVARKAKPGQFIILRTDEHGERIPLTMAGHDSKKGTIDLIYAAVGRTTMLMDQLEEGDYLLGWNDAPGTYRYCHSFDDSEIESLIAGVASNAHLVNRFRADGRANDSNEYLVFRR